MCVRVRTVLGCDCAVYDSRVCAGWSTVHGVVVVRVRMGLFDCVLWLRGCVRFCTVMFECAWRGSLLRMVCSSFRVLCG